MQILENHTKYERTNEHTQAGIFKCWKHFSFLELLEAFYIVLIGFSREFDSKIYPAQLRAKIILKYDIDRFIDTTIITSIILLLII